MEDWDTRILPVTIIFDQVPQHYPDSMSLCIECGEDLIGDDELYPMAMTLADCQIHSFHSQCVADDGVCPICWAF